VKKVCVYCGSSPGLGDAYISAARLLGSELAKREICLVYGGGRIGVMGEIASAAFREGGEVIGVIPKDLAEKEMASPELSDLIVVPSMHDRKAMMIELADAFFEVLTWAQLGIHQKPCGLLNVDGYYDRLTNFLDHVEEAQFVPSAHRAMIMIDDDPAGLLKRLEKYKSIEVDKATWAKGFSGK
jgi:uncharacterized protein (TIGR00730 family)